MAKKPKPEGKKYNYMDTYGDLVTLLLCFFVLLFAMSTIQEEKFNAFAQGLASTFAGPQANPGGGGAPPTTPNSVPPPPQDASAPPQGDIMAPEQQLPEDFSQLGQAIEKFMEENNMQGQVTVEMGESGVAFIRVQDNLLFDGNSSAIRPEAQAFLGFLGQSFLAVENQIYRANFVGHTASVAGSGVDDWLLSCERSGGVASFFQNEVGFAPAKMETTGYGKNYPIADNQTDEGRASNRRVDIVVVSNNPDSLMQALAEASRIYFPQDSTAFYEGDPTDLPGTTLDTIAALTATEGSQFDVAADDVTGTAAG